MPSRNKRILDNLILDNIQVAAMGGGAAAAQVIQSGLIFDLRMDDGSGQAVTDYANGNNATLGVDGTVEATKDPAWNGGGILFSGSDHLVNAYSAGLNTLLDGGEITMTIVAKVSAAGVWSDGTFDLLWRFDTDAALLTRIDLFKHSDGSLRFGYVAGNVTDAVTLGGLSTTDAFSCTITASKTGDVMRAFYNGTQTGVDQTTLGNWTGNLKSTVTVLGNSITTGTIAWNGHLYYTMIYDRALTPAEVLTNHNQLKTILADRGVSLNP